MLWIEISVAVVFTFFGIVALIQYYIRSKSMNNNNQEFVNTLLKRLVKLNYIKPGDVPNIDLYMDQVTTFMDEHLSDVKRHEDDKILTKTMINNYTKNNLLPPPVKKKYSKEHIYVLTFIYYLKNILSISDIQKLLNPLTDKFFDTDEVPDLDTIYSEIYSMEKSTELAKSTFKDVSDDEDRDFLQLFTLVCLLSFDVYMKKNIIESLIDDYTSRTSQAGRAKTKEEIKEEKREAKEEAKEAKRALKQKK